MFFLTNISHFKVLPVTFIEFRQNVNKHDISQIKLLGKMGGVYVTDVANADKGQ